jgi:hypothetical protein
MFRRLKPFASASLQVRAALMEIGRAGGIMDAKDVLTKSPAELITNLALSANNPNNPNQSAGTTFIGQLLDHDMTFDQTSKLGVPTEARRSPNARNPTLQLDSVYGLRPRGSPQLYDPADSAKLRIDSGGLGEVVPRGQNKVATIAEPRNDENLMISGLQAAFIKFHNRAVDYVRQQGASSHRDPDEDGDDDDRKSAEGVLQRDLPIPTISGFETGQPTSLPQRNLLRQLTFQLPSAQASARAMGAPLLSAGDLSDLQGLGVGFETSAPLFFYILREAHIMASGLALRPVGGRIVGEVFVGMPKSDDESYRSVNRGWRPILPTRSG